VPIIYKVERTRDGHTFATRQVLATQKGRVIFTMHASFQRPVDGVEHQQPMPDAPNPDEIPPWEKVLESYRTDPRIPLKIRQKLASMKVAPAPLEMRFVEPIDRVMRQVLEPRQRVWMRSKGKLSDDQALQRCVAAYASDWTFIETALRPHKHIPGRNEMQVLSLDHSMWFHKPFRADEWLLYVQTSPQAGHGRGLVFGQIYTQSGELVISTAQEGMLRKTDHGVKSRL
jgi:acyl-coenzyme A thioesterase 1/2/4